MMVLMRRRRHYTPLRKFVPAVAGSPAGAILEGRSLAAPALGMQPLPAINSAFSQIDGWGMGGQVGGDILPQSSLPAMSVGAINGTLINNIPATSGYDWMTGQTVTNPGSTFTMLGQGFAQVLDFPNPGNGSGSGNVGNVVVSAVTSDKIVWTATGAQANLVDEMGVASGWTRAYTMADSTAAPAGSGPGAVITYNSPPMFLKETYSVQYVPPPANYPTIMNGGPALNTGPNLGPNGIPVGGLVLCQSLILGLLRRNPA